MLVCVLLDVIVLAVFWGSEMQATVARGHGMHKGALTTNSNNARRDVRLELPAGREVTKSRVSRSGWKATPQQVIVL
jgi:hypothetical protein